MGHRALQITTAITICFLIGCAKGVDTSSTATPVSNSSTTSSTEKSLFSKWIDTSGFVSIDLTQGQFDVQSPFPVATANGQSCSCEATPQGNQSSGSITVVSCTGNLNYDGLTCSNFNGTAQYTLQNSSLTFCEATLGGCITFE